MNVTHERINLFITFDYNEGEEWCRVYLPYTYENIVSTIIKKRYDEDKMQAVINNYLLDNSSDHTEEFKEMLAWRSKAKEVAKQVLEQL